jgi:hypothetical protein
VVELAEQVLDFPRAHLRFGVIERHRAVEPALRRLEPLARFLEVAEEMHGMSEQARKANHLAGFIVR